MIIRVKPAEEAGFFDVTVKQFDRLNKRRRKVKTMKKVLAYALVFAFALSATTAMAHEGGLLRSGLGVKANLNLEQNLGADKFVAVGEIKSKATNSLVLTVQSGAHLNNISNGTITVATNANTDIKIKGNDDAAMTDLAVGNKVLVSGNLSGSTYTADRIMILGQRPEHDVSQKVNKVKAVGEVTAVKNNSITIKNSITGESQTISTDSDTDVRINGEAETMADVKVGDKGFVKIRKTVSGVIAKFINLFR